jgi:hypothetical protein
MADHIINPHQTKWERLKKWVKSWAPQVKQAVIGAIVLIVLTVAGWVFFSKSKPEISIGNVSGGNNQFGNQNTMVINSEVTNAVRSLEAVLTYDLALQWTKRGPKSSMAGIVGNNLLTLGCTADTNRPLIKFISTSETTEVIEGLGLRGRYELKLAPFTENLTRQALTNYDLILSSLRLINFEDNVLEGDVAVKNVKVRFLVNSTETYEVSAATNEAMKLNRLASGTRISIRARPFVTENRIP